jgi:hypothetical protein
MYVLPEKLFNNRISESTVEVKKAKIVADSDTYKDKITISI